MIFLISKQATHKGKWLDPNREKLVTDPAALIIHGAIPEVMDCSSLFQIKREREGQNIQPASPIPRMTSERQGRQKSETQVLREKQERGSS